MTSSLFIFKKRGKTLNLLLDCVENRRSIEIIRIIFKNDLGVRALD